MKTTSFKFRHQYEKLARPEFTTIRGKGKYKTLAVGETVTCETPNGSFGATVACKVLARVREIPLETLRQDAEYPGCVISTRQQFVNLLNSLRPPSWARASEDSEMTIIWLRKCNV